MRDDVLTDDGESQRPIAGFAQIASLMAALCIVGRASAKAESYRVELEGYIAERNAHGMGGLVLN
jgi:hypothetical protein